MLDIGPAWSVSIGVERERGPNAAEWVEADVPQLAAALASAERRCGLYFDIARGWTQTRDDWDAETTRYLDTADRITPTRIRNDPTPSTWCSPWTGGQRQTWELNSLRNRFGIGTQRFTKCEQLTTSPSRTGGRRGRQCPGPQRRRHLIG